MATGPLDIVIAEICSMAAQNIGPKARPFGELLSKIEIALQMHKSLEDANYEFIALNTE